MDELTLRQRFSPRRFFGGLGPHPGAHHTRTRNVYILPTRQGLGFLVVLGVMLVGAINYVNSMAFAFTFLLASVGITSIVHTWRNLQRLTIRVRAPQPVFAGQTPMLTVIIDNPGPPRPALELALNRHEPPLRITAPAGQTHCQLELPPGPRGRHSVPSFEVSTRYPLGLFRAWTIVHAEDHYLIWPEPLPHAPEPPGDSGHQEAGREAAAGRDDFAGLRDWRPGDALYHVHWKAAARQPGLLVKEFRGEQSEEVLIDWFALPERDPETRLSGLCRQILTAQARNQRYALRLPGTTIPAGQGMTHRQRCLDALALWHADPR